MNKNELLLDLLQKYFGKTMSNPKVLGVVQKEQEIFLIAEKIRLLQKLSQEST